MRKHPGKDKGARDTDEEGELDDREEETSLIGSTSVSEGMFRSESSKLQYRYVGFLKEDHGQPIFGVSVNHHLGPDQPTVFATVGNNRVTIYEAQPHCKHKFFRKYF